MKIYDLFKLGCIKEIEIETKIHLMVRDGTELNNGNLVVVLYNSIIIYDGKNYELIKIINEYESAIQSICSIKDNRFITASYDDPRLIFWKNDSKNYKKQH